MERIMSQKSVEFRSTSRNLQIWIPLSMKDGFSVKFTDGVHFATEEEAVHLRNSPKCGQSFVEVKAGAVLPKKPPSTEPTVVNESSVRVTAEQEFKDAFGATTREYQPPAVHIHQEPAPDPNPDAVMPSVDSVPKVRKPFTKAPVKENTDVPNHQGA